MKCEVAAGGRWNLKDRASGVLVPDIRLINNARERMGEREWGRREMRERGNPFVLTEREQRLCFLIPDLVKQGYFMNQLE